ncbi:MAG: biotin--[acetyl-CoA-carboxylase] ligase [Phycisphaeraceae bacterium]
MGATQNETQLLALLLASREPLPLEAVGRALGCAPVEAAVLLERLEGKGCRLARHPQHGVQLLESSLTCWSTYIEGRRPGLIGRKVSVYRETTSTQELARKMLKPGGNGHDGHVLVSDHQSAGRGRLGRPWITAPGAALLMTAIVGHGQATVDRLMLAACCGVAEGIEAATGIGTQVRWPNDVLMNGAKMAGIIVETVGKLALIGIGINVHGAPRTGRQVTLRSPATSLAEQGQAVDRLLLMERVLEQLQAALYTRPSDDLYQAWRERAALLQQRVTVEADGRQLTGRVIDLDPTQGLLLQLDRGQVVTLPAQTTSLVLEGTGDA